MKSKQIKFREVGYTPANMQLLIISLGKTSKEFAKDIGVTLRTVDRWLSPVDMESHASCSHVKWLQILNIYNISNETYNWKPTDIKSYTKLTFK